MTLLDKKESPEEKETMEVEEGNAGRKIVVAGWDGRIVVDAGPAVASGKAWSLEVGVEKPKLRGGS